MRIAGWLMLPGEGDAVRLSPGAVTVAGGHIAAVEEGEAALAGACDLGGPGCVVMPGLIDAHVHLPQFGVIGAHGLGLLDWLERVTYPAERAWADADFALQQAEQAISRMLRCGTTGFAAYATSHHAGALAAMAVAETVGVRAHIGQVLMDRGAPADLCPPIARQIDETAALLERNPPGQRVSAAVTPRFAPACSAELLSRAGALAAQSGSLIQTHLAETVGECERVRELFGRGSYAGVYRDAGLLTDRTVLGHGIYIDDADRQALAQSGAVVAHCPPANSFLMSGRFDRARALRAGVRVGLGSDIGAGYEVSMVRVARAMVETAGALAGGRDGGAAALPTAAQAWHAVTAGNAAVLGWPDAGRLGVGCPADLVLLKPDAMPGPDRTPDTLASMLFGWDDRWVKATLLRGVVAWSDGPATGPR